MFILFSWCLCHHLIWKYHYNSPPLEKVQTPRHLSIIRQRGWDRRLFRISLLLTINHHMQSINHQSPTSCRHKVQLLTSAIGGGGPLVVAAEYPPGVGTAQGQDESENNNNNLHGGHCTRHRLGVGGNEGLCPLTATDCTLWEVLPRDAATLMLPPCVNVAAPSRALFILASLMRALTPCLPVRSAVEGDDLLTYVADQRNWPRFIHHVSLLAPRKIYITI